MVEHHLEGVESRLDRLLVGGLDHQVSLIVELVGHAETAQQFTERRLLVGTPACGLVDHLLGVRVQGRIPRRLGFLDRRVHLLLVAGPYDQGGALPHAGYPTDGQQLVED